MNGRSKTQGAGPAERARAVLTGLEAVARMERAITGAAPAADPAVAEGLALAGLAAASLGEGVAPAGGEGIALSGASCVHHLRATPGRTRDGAFELAATSVQEAADHCLAAHLLSRRLGRPGACSLAPVLADQLALVSLPSSGAIDALLASGAGPELEAGPERIFELAQEAFSAVGRALARVAAPLELCGEEAAEVVLVASGAEAVAAREAARALTAAGVRAASLALLLVRPFPEKDVRRLLGGARLVLALHDPSGPPRLLGAIRAAVGEKVEVQALAAAEPAPLLEAIARLLPESSFDPLRLAPPAARAPARRLIVAPAGPWAEETARRILACLASLGPLRLERSGVAHPHATTLAWEGAGALAAAEDLLLASHPAALDPAGALSGIRPHGALLLLSTAESPDALAGLLSASVRELMRARELRVHWVVPPATGPGTPLAGADRASSLVLAGAALAVVCGTAAAAEEALASAGDGDDLHWLRAGAQGLRSLDASALAAPALGEELDFRPARRLPRMPAAVQGPEEPAPAWIARFHRSGPGSFEPAPGPPARPLVLEALAERLRGAGPQPFVVAPSGDASRPLAARGLQELLREGIEGMQGACLGARTLADNLTPLVASAARLLADQGSGAPLHALLAAAGEKLAERLTLSADEGAALRRDLDELRRRLPPGALAFAPSGDAALRLYLAVVDALRGPLRRRFAARLARLRERLRDLLQLDRMGSAAGRAPRSLHAELGGRGAQYLDLDAFSRTLPAGPGSGVLAPERRRRIEGVLATIEAQLAQPVPPPSALLLRPPGVELAVPGIEPVEHLDPLAAAVGYFDGVAARMAPLFRAVRLAELEVEGRYRPELYDEPLARLDWQAFSGEELALVPPVVVVTSGCRLRRRGQGSLSELLRSSRPVHVLVHDEVAAADEAADPSRYHIDLGYLVVAHREAFAIGSTLARPERLTEGLARLVQAPRPGVVLLRLPAPELAPWHALLAEAALRGRACPDFLYDPDAGPNWADRFDLGGNPEPESAWPLERIAVLGEGGDEQSLEVAFTFADAVALEPAYRRHLRILPRSAWDEGQIPLAEYLERFDPEGRERSIPYLWTVDDTGELGRAVVTRELALACRDRLRNWRVLQELAGHENAYAAEAAAAAREQALAEAAREREELERAHAVALAGARAEGARESMERLAAVLIHPEGFAASAPPPLRPAAPPELAQAAAAPERAPAEAAVEEEALSFDEPYVDSVLCTTCNECTNLNSRLFQYNAEKQAIIADASAGTFAELVKAAELCPALCIHPGKPRSGDSTATPELIARAAAFK